MKSYVVFKGRKPGVYDTWAECNDQISGFPGNLYQRFDDEDKAKLALAKYQKCQSQAEAIDKVIAEATKSGEKKNKPEVLSIKDCVIVALVVVILVQLAFICSK